MSAASVVFLPWVRQGLAARLATPDPLSGALPAQAPLGVTLAVNGVDAPPMAVRLFGPGDVLGIDARQVVRTEPPAGTIDYEANDLAAVEFDNPDLPWLFTPAGADAQGRLRPWIVLVVVRQQDGVRLRPPRDEPLPVLEIAAPAVPAAELPDLAESWAWAHAQLATREGATEAELRTVLATRPELSVGRLLSPRLLTPFTDYIACVVPAFDSGRRAGLGEAVDANAALAPAWRSGKDAPGGIRLPVYHHWQFRTGAREDFESMVARLVPRDLSAVAGRRPMDIGRPGFAVAGGEPPPVLLEGALQPVGAPRAALADGAGGPWQQTLQAIVNAANARAAGRDAVPVVGPPIYGRWYAGRHEVATAGARTWLDELNLDPRERVAAALGTHVVQRQQEELMAEAWQQAGELAQANQRLRQMQLSLAITGRLHARHVERIDDDDALWRFASPAQARLLMPATATGSVAMTMRTLLGASSTPQATVSAAMRRLSRPGGAISRRAAMALRSAGVQAPAVTAAGMSSTAISSVAISSATTTAMALTTAGNTSAMFRLYTAQPLPMTFTLPPTRGLVSFDAVTRRLPTQFAGMVHARATEAVVTAMPPRPAFVVSAEPAVAPTLSTVGGLSATLTSGAGLRAVRLRPGGELPDLPEPEEPEPGPTRPPPPPRFDSADAKAFREAAARHLARVNPPAPLVFTAVARRAVLDPAALRRQVRALLDPAPAMMRRMAATIRVDGPQASRPIGPIGGAPVFAQPMSEALATLSQDWLLPGLDRVPPDSVALLEPNARFIEAYMLGLNVEMGRELLWRDFVVRDPRATFFRRFWRTVRAGSEGDIAPIAQWADRPLGSNAAATGGVRQVVLLVRSGLFRRYPGASVYAVPAVAVGSGRRPGEQGAELQPLFRGALQPDVSFFGFDLDPAVASGDPGWYFVIQQQPTEPRFGFDVDIDFGTATHVSLAAPPAGHALPAGTIWKFNAAHMALITQQQPVRVAIHASELITPADGP